MTVLDMMKQHITEADNTIEKIEREMTRTPIGTKTYADLFNTYQSACRLRTHLKKNLELGIRTDDLETEVNDLATKVAAKEISPEDAMVELKMLQLRKKGLQKETMINAAAMMVNI